MCQCARASVGVRGELGPACVQALAFLPTRLPVTGGSGAGAAARGGGAAAAAAAAAEAVRRRALLLLLFPLPGELQGAAPGWGGSEPGPAGPRGSRAGAVGGAGRVPA